MTDIMRKYKCSIEAETVGYSSTTIDRLDQHLKSVLEDKNYYCGGYSIVKNNQLIANSMIGPRKPFGESKPFEMDSIRRIASITKLFTSVAIMQLLEKGLLHLHQPVSEILPQFKTAMHKRITIFQLLTHTSGLPADGGSYFEPYNREMSWEGNEWMEVFLGGPMMYKPGEVWAYSTLGIGIVGAIIASVTGLAYEDYVIKHITKPLGMVRTFFRIPPNMMDEVACADEQELKWLKKEFENKDNDPMPAWYPGGGLKSTMNDLIIFAKMLLNKGTYNNVKILSRRSVELMTNNVLDESVSQYCYGANGANIKWGIGFDVNHGTPLMNGGFGHEGAGRCGMAMHAKDQMILIYFLPLYKDQWEWRANKGFRTMAWSGVL